MRWDSSRTVPWQRLVVEWLVFVAIMAVVFYVTRGDRPFTSSLAGLFISGPMYLAFGYVAAKFGYRRKSLKEMRTATEAKRSAADDADEADGPAAPRPKPAPTRRTGGGGRNRPRSKGTRRKR